MESFNYNLIKCEVCGVGWAQHPISCLNHHLRAERGYRLCLVAKGDPLWPETLKMLLRNESPSEPNAQIWLRCLGISPGLPAETARATTGDSANIQK